MKQQDIAIVIVIIFIAGIASYFVSTKFITPGKHDKKAEIVSAISSDFPLPDDSVFNGDAVNPTVRIQLVPGDNAEPFGTKAH